MQFCLYFLPSTRGNPGSSDSHKNKSVATLQQSLFVTIRRFLLLVWSLVAWFVHISWWNVSHSTFVRNSQSTSFVEVEERVDIDHHVSDHTCECKSDVVERDFREFIRRSRPVARCLHSSAVHMDSLYWLLYGRRIQEVQDRVVRWRHIRSVKWPSSCSVSSLFSRTHGQFTLIIVREACSRSCCSLKAYPIRQVTVQLLGVFILHPYIWTVYTDYCTGSVFEMLCSNVVVKRIWEVGYYFWVIFSGMLFGLSITGIYDGDGSTTYVSESYLSFVV